MVIASKATAIALTGPFGSGCSTVAGILHTHKHFTPARLSTEIKRHWAAEHGSDPTRLDLQKLGNEMRERSGNAGVLAEEAIRTLENDQTEHKFLTFDGIRNLGEIETLKDRFGRRFYMIAVDCPTAERWERLEHTEYVPRGGDMKDFVADDQRDQDQEYVYGQQVQLCVDQADVLVTNDNSVTLASLQKKTIQYAELVIGEKPRYATPAEILMNMAYSSAHGSKCLKRQVGAVVVAAPPWKMGEVVGNGFNENPLPTLPCVEEPSYGAKKAKGTPGRCYRDIVRQRGFQQLVQENAHCPQCGDVIKGPIGKAPPWRCRSCNVNLERYFWRERAMSLCTAVHAEVAAVLSAGTRARGATIYTTTFPCFQCTEKLIQAGIKAVVYTEPYPDVQAAQRFKLAGVRAYRFEGVRSGRFDEIFARARPFISDQMKILGQSA